MLYIVNVKTSLHVLDLIMEFGFVIKLYQCFSGCIVFICSG